MFEDSVADRISLLCENLKEKKLVQEVTEVLDLQCRLNKEVDEELPIGWESALTGCFKSHQDPIESLSNRLNFREMYRNAFYKKYIAPYEHFLEN